VDQKKDLDLLKIFQSEEGPRLVINHTRRFDLAHREIREYLDQKKLGALISFRGVFSKGLIHNGIHAIDLLSFWCGKPLRIEAKGGQKRGNDLYGLFGVILENGIQGTLEALEGLDYSLFDFDFIYEKGRICVRDIGYHIEIFEAQAWKEYPGVKKPTLTLKPSPTLDTAMYQLYDFVGSGASGDEWQKRLQEAVEATRLLLDFKETFK
jgi:hypothetical protein